MSPLAKEVIRKLSEEQDTQVLAEVLDFYEYLKQKKQKEFQKGWASIEEDEPDAEEIKTCKEYKKSEEDLVPLENLIRELNLDGE
ncbi:hypothetical protein [Marinisporobacter balticus]|uniref:DUF2281 domain-containing protein n=1 Tax=Marinisporobacter balticus TaxID=2018667 RepID=A0A4R2K5J8_9FIRM|nr:hypothetical protein [Marinisporobacter balticus]TCO68513.1 hypothetical protein EV214_1434 [Marinisporobacter balticus]